MNICKECEMPILDGEFHPYAACLMFRGCGDAGIVRKNLIPFHQQRLRAEAAEAKLRALEMQDHPVGEINVIDKTATGDVFAAYCNTPIKGMQKLGQKLYAKPFTKQEDK